MHNHRANVTVRMKCFIPHPTQSRRFVPAPSSPRRSRCKARSIQGVSSPPYRLR
uniref:Uncharacterized protein n=1 Tax=uncultured marine virus TaxID=186617 RepID=A0A0F7L4C7_9VIRU|nr:hypothetical protein [uncultured marine virus]